MISLDELPTEELIELSKIEGREQIIRMKSMAQACLVNPVDQEKLDSLSFSQFGRFIKLWLISSNTSDSIFKEDDLDDK